MPKVRVVSGLKNNKSALSVKPRVRTGGALKKMLCEEAGTGISNLDKLRHSLKTMHLTDKPKKGKKRFVEI